MAWQIAHDRWGIPHIDADSVTELALAQGIDIARHRGDQLRMLRRRGLGTTAADPHFTDTAAAVDWDSFVRRARLVDIARRAHDRLDAEHCAFLAGYVDGVNRVLGDGWPDWTPLLIFAVDHIGFGSFPAKLRRDLVRRSLGSAGERAFGLVEDDTGGSNVLGLGPDRTATGLPLIAGDPHRGFEHPNVYAQVHLRGPGIDVHGYTFPGVPGVQHFAHAGEVAWAITNAAADHQDLYLEQLTADDDGRVWAMGPGGTEECEVVTETIEAAGRSPVTIRVIITARGPVIMGAPGEPDTLSLRTTSWADGDLGFAALLPLLRSRSVADVRQAMTSWVEPVNNLVIADRSGTLLHQVVGRVPSRPTAPVPRPADDPDARWQGVVDPLPRIPITDGSVVSCNDRATADYDAIGHGFTRPYRAVRMRELLAGRASWSAATIVEVLLDVHQTAGITLLQRIETLPPTTPGQTAVRSELADWDRRMAADSRAAARFVAVRDALVAALIDHPALRPFVDAVATAGPTYPPVARPFLDPATTIARAVPALLDRADRLGIDIDALLAVAVARAAAAESITWGECHRFTPVSPAAGLGLNVSAPIAAGRPLSGDADCLAATGWLPGSDRSLRGPVARYVWDLADRSASRWAVPTGAHESGDHAADQFDAWSTGDLVPLVDDHDQLQVIMTSDDHD